MEWRVHLQRCLDNETSLLTHGILKEVHRIEVKHPSTLATAGRRGPAREMGDRLLVQSLEQITSRASYTHLKQLLDQH